MSYQAITEYLDPSIIIVVLLLFAAFFSSFYIARFGIRAIYHATRGRRS